MQKQIEGGNMSCPGEFWIREEMQNLAAVEVVAMDNPRKSTVRFENKECSRTE